MEKQLILNVYIEFYNKLNKSKFDMELKDIDEIALKKFIKFTQKRIDTEWLFYYAIHVFTTNPKTSITAFCDTKRYAFWSNSHVDKNNKKINEFIKKHKLVDPNKFEKKPYKPSERYLQSLRERTATHNILYFDVCLEMELYLQDNIFCKQCEMNTACYELYGKEKMQKLWEPIRRKQMVSAMCKVQPRKNLWKGKGETPTEEV